jgi:hypothetical protein
VTDEASILANAERLRAALVSAATDALRDALRRTLGTVRCTPTQEGESRYLLAQFSGSDAALLEWLAIGDAASQPGLLCFRAHRLQIIPAGIKRYLSTRNGHICVGSGGVIRNYRNLNSHEIFFDYEPNARPPRMLPKKRGMN